MVNKKFEDIEPIEDSEVKKTIQELLVDPGFIHAVKYILPDLNWDDFTKEMSSYNSKYDFQSKMISPTIWGLAAHNSTSINASGWENIGKNVQVILSNHRDIILDAGLLNILRNREGIETTEIAIGDNLLIHPWIEKLVRLNKSFIVRRGVSVRQMLEVSTHLSEYIHHVITEKKESVWIAQREGRAKDSNDRTQESLLKMLTLAPKTKNFIDSLKELNITPLSISYEYDPCDYLKAMEFQMKRDNPEYKKEQIDDLRSMEIGILGFKGDIHFQFGKCINSKLDSIALLDRKEQITAVAKLIDKEIYTNYKIYKINYIAYDLLRECNEFCNKYTPEDFEKFQRHIDKQIEKIALETKDISYLRTKLLEMYSNTLKNYLNAREE